MIENKSVHIHVFVGHINDWHLEFPVRNTVYLLFLTPLRNQQQAGFEICSDPVTMLTYFVLWLNAPKGKKMHGAMFPLPPGQYLTPAV